ncbi:MAG: prolipoprotein diacylglyceryl transferase [Candidatus Rhabdochlamydia sp.]
MFAYLYWDPSPAIFPWKLPILDRPLLWYGAFFALGIMLAHQILLSLFKKEGKSAYHEGDTFTLSLLLGIILGARLFDILFYQGWMVMKMRPLALLYFWEGGLSSHGGVIGLIAALILYQRKHPSMTLLKLLDSLSVVAGLPAACIRMGNFFNQEILGKVTTVPWGIIFGHPIDGSSPIPRHPVQLYESVFYFALFAVMMTLYHQKKLKRDGALCGLFVTSVFVFRFLIEYFKEEQSAIFLGSVFTMGQILSIPFIIGGLILLKRQSTKEFHSV